MSYRVRRLLAALAAAASPFALMGSIHPAVAATGTCGTPTGITATDNGDGASATVNWTEVGTCSAVAIYAYGSPSGSTSGPIVSVHPSSDTIGGLIGGNQYVFTVTAFDSVANMWTAWSAWSAWTPIQSGPPPGGNPYGDPNLVSMFDGTDLNGWTPSAAGGWIVQNGAIHGTGTAGRGWIYYNKAQYASFRWIFNVRQIVGNHQPTILFWGTLNPIRDALSSVQFQPPNGFCWDYQPGTNNGCPGMITSFPHATIDIHSWSQCELLADGAAGTARMACCPLGTATTCKAIEVLDFHNPSAGHMGPLAIQVHNGGIQDEYKSLYVESPVADPAHLITT